MKFLVAALIMVSSLTSFARQYTQCSDMDKDLYGVINLPSATAGTLFLTIGAETDTRALYNIEFKKTVADKTHYSFVTQYGSDGLVVVPSDLIGSKSDYVYVEIREGGLTHRMTCFTHVYND